MPDRAKGGCGVSITAEQLEQPAWRLEERTEKQRRSLSTLVEPDAEATPLTEATLADLWRGVREAQGR